MSTIKAFRIEKEFRRRQEYDRGGFHIVKWSEYAGAADRGLIFRPSSILIVYWTEGGSSNTVHYFFNEDRQAVMTRISTQELESLVREGLVRELT